MDWVILYHFTGGLVYRSRIVRDEFDYVVSLRLSACENTLIMVGLIRFCWFAALQAYIQIPHSAG